jgi:hypothetical protein
MPRYFFNLCIKQGPAVPDNVGILFPDLAAARADAIEGVQETIAELRAAGEPIEFEAVEIADIVGRTLAVVPFVNPVPHTHQTKFVGLP